MTPVYVCGPRGAGGKPVEPAATIRLLVYAGRHIRGMMLKTMLATLTHKFSQKTVQDIFDLNNATPKRLNLQPGFQRKSVWKLKDRRLLVDSILKGYPLPSIFLYCRTNERGAPVYDVLDGKQRIESLLMFTGQIRGSRFELIPDGETESRDWRKLSSRDREKLLGFSIQVAEVSGEWEEIVSLFVRINSTGKKLDRAEITRANYLTAIS